jgi:hypothetical protein
LTTTATSFRRSESRAAALVREARAEVVLAVAALVVVSVHVADDSFVQPQRGTSAGDHLLSGLVPVAVLLGVSCVYWRLRPGLRASLAALLGLFAVVTGIEAVYYAHASHL